MRWLCALAVASFAAGIGAEPARPGHVAEVRHEGAEAAPTLGPRFAPVTIEFFVDSRSSASRWLYKQLRELAERHPTRLRIVFRFPFTDTFSNAARVAFRQGQFIELADAVYGGNFRRHDEIEAIVTELGMSWERFDAQLNAPFHAAQAERDRFHARRWGVRELSASRPGLLVNGVPFRGQRRSLPALEQAYDGAYRHAQELLARGVSLPRLYRTLLSETLIERPPLQLPIGTVDGGPITDAERENHPSLAGPLDLRLAHLRRASTTAPAQPPEGTIAWFCSLQSRACARMFSAMEELHTAFPELQLAFFHAYDAGDETQEGARALHLGALCADDQGDLWAFLKQTFARHPRGKVGAELLEDIATRAGLDGARLVECAQTDETGRRLDARLQAFRRGKLSRTPTVVAGGLAYLGERDFYQLSLIADGELRPGLVGRALWPLGGR